ncbi:MAG TPA: signal recognition particle-docking protein FtsY, partial [Gammaproteobacteria bacterium]|nr:signal recognition particle-docking protein FtsY [Gammaproteobacteria bacterium]
MFGFLKRKQQKSETNQAETGKPAIKQDTASDDSAAINTTTDTEHTLEDSLEKTRHGFADSMADFFLGKKSIDQDMLDELESQLLSADVGMDATTAIIDELHNSISRKAINDEAALHLTLANVMKKILQPCEQPLSPDVDKKPFVILVVGINGAGKTTSIGKLAHHFIQQGKSVMLAAGDTFRAAAVEQLQTWGERNNVPVIAQGTGADPA